MQFFSYCFSITELVYVAYPEGYAIVILCYESYVFCPKLVLYKGGSPLLILIAESYEV